MVAKWQRFRIDTPDDFDEDMREALGKEVVEFIRKRSEKGKDKNNEPFPKYSKEYINSLDFKNAGKSKRVNLTLSGDMLIALDVLSHNNSSIWIGFEKGSDENAKADGNVRGTYGKEDPDPNKARDFMGISDDDLDKLIKKVKRNF